MGGQGGSVPPPRNRNFPPCYRAEVFGSHGDESSRMFSPGGEPDAGSAAVWRGALAGARAHKTVCIRVSEGRRGGGAQICFRVFASGWAKVGSDSHVFVEGCGAVVHRLLIVVDVGPNGLWTD